MQYTVKFAEDAQTQLDQLYTYIADESGDIRADAFVSGIVTHCLSLATFPERGMRRDDIRPHLRIMAYRRSVIIASTIDHTDVTIIGVFYGGRDIDTILGGDESS